MAHLVKKTLLTNLNNCLVCSNLLFLVSYVEERPRWPIQSPNKEQEECERLRRGSDQIKFIDLRFERWQFVRFRKARRRQDVP